MWADDALWVPLLLEQRFFSGRFLFDSEQMLDHELEELVPNVALQNPRVVGNRA
jgi:hypothetical protein